MSTVHLIGYIAAMLTTIIYLPQAIKTIKVKHTKGVAHATYYFATIAAFVWIIYGLLIRDIPLIISNGIVFITASVTLYFLFKHR